MTGDSIRYETYQDVADDFPDIRLEDFREAARFIEMNGKIYSGPAAAYRSFKYGPGWQWLWPLYQNNSLFRWVSDRGYQWISEHRELMYKLSVRLFGKNPAKPKNYWMVYLLAILAIITLLIIVL